MTRRTIWRPKEHVDKKNQMVTRNTWWQEQYGEVKRNNFVKRRTWGQKNNMVTRIIW